MEKSKMKILGLILSYRNLNVFLNNEVRCTKYDVRDMPSAARLILLISLMFLLACFPPLARGEAVPSEFNLAAQNSILKLYINRKNSQLLIQDLRNDKIWRSSPLIKEESKIVSLWKTHLESPLILYYVDEGMERVRQTNPIRDKAAMSFQSTEKGLKINYQFTKLKIEFSLKFEIRRLPEGKHPYRRPQGKWRV